MQACIHLRQMRDKLLSSLPPLSLENGRTATFCDARPLEHSTAGPVTYGDRHRTEPKRLSCMLGMCMSHQAK